MTAPSPLAGHQAVACVTIDRYTWRLIMLWSPRPSLVLDGPRGQREVAEGLAEIDIAPGPDGFALNPSAARERLMQIAKVDLADHLAEIAREFGQRERHRVADQAPMWGRLDAIRARLVASGAAVADIIELVESANDDYDVDVTGRIVGFLTKGERW